MKHHFCTHSTSNETRARTTLQLSLINSRPALQFCDCNLSFLHFDNTYIVCIIDLKTRIILNNLNSFSFVKFVYDNNRVVVGKWRVESRKKWKKLQ